jgi:hypothetical protein
MWKSDRICGSNAKLGVFHGSNDNNSNSKDYTFPSTRHLKDLVDAYAQWINGFLDDGWDGYLFQVMFNNLLANEIQRSFR